MKKKIYISALAIVLALSLVGCGSPVENNVQPTTSDSSNIIQSESVVDQETEEIPDTIEPKENVEVSTEVEESTEPTLSEEEIRKMRSTAILISWWI